MEDNNCYKKLQHFTVTSIEYDELVRTNKILKDAEYEIDDSPLHGGCKHVRILDKYGNIQKDFSVHIDSSDIWIQMND